MKRLRTLTINLNILLNQEFLVQQKYKNRNNYEKLKGGRKSEGTSSSVTLHLFLTAKLDVDMLKEPSKYVYAEFPHSQKHELIQE